MYGLRGINNIYVSDGTGRDWILCGNQEFRQGKIRPLPYLTACMDRQCMPPVRRGPAPASRDHIEQMHTGWKPLKAGGTLPPPKAKKPVSRPPSHSSSLRRSASEVTYGARSHFLTAAIQAFEEEHLLNRWPSRSGVPSQPPRARSASGAGRASTMSVTG
eukprot:gnl/MRDRNA2_/MRDRNA2_129230_c0_seq1.p1 gnl/MRDRNA2_/MRDRNA2_129230_c0~~gnl/MRDRNA2_/MRDRNA2_129230_c0_seq1.p1  ORF type:complete len:160 (-),score=9.10 gnl/MRDRNA2_/MRDRNA2_129230_c0_seq1:63-542(-)